MLDNIIAPLMALLYGKVPENAPAPDLVAKKHLEALYFNPPSKPGPKHQPNAAKKLIDQATAAINNRLLVAKEGIQLINELHILQIAEGGKNFTVDFTFCFQLPPKYEGSEPRQAQGYTDIEHPNGDYGMRDDIQIYLLYADQIQVVNPATNAKDVITYDELRFDLTKRLDTEASRLALAIFHELLHVWFFRTDGDPNYSGHETTSGVRVYEPVFEARYKRFRSQLIALEDKLFNRKK